MLDRSLASIVALLVATVASNAQPPLFPTPITPTGKGPTGLAAADLDHDGRIDVVLANRSSDDVSVALSLGDGRFTIGASDPCGDGPSAISLGDVDGDGEVDAIVANQGGDVGVLRGDGTGDLLAVQSILGGSPLKSLSIVDVDNDGDLDPIVGILASATGSIRCLKNDGAGGFGVVATLTFFSVRNLAAGDVTGDGIADVVALTNTSPAFAVVERGLGNGSFAFHESEGYLAPELLANGCALVDVDADGDRDVLIAEEEELDGSGHFMRNDGTGHLVQAVVVTTVPGTRTVVAADVTDDGVPDFVGFGSGSAGVGEGSGHPDTSTPFAPLRVVSVRGGAGAVFDVDQDGRLDLVAAAEDTGGLGVALQDAFGRFGGAPTEVFYGLVSTTANADVDHDGDLDACAVSVSPSVLRIEKNDGFGNLAPAPLSPVPAFNVMGVIAADVNGDGNVDMVLPPVDAGNPLQVGLLNPVGAVTSWMPTPLPQLSHIIQVNTELGDVDLDGRLDVVFLRTDTVTAAPSIAIFPGNGDGSFAPQIATLSSGFLFSPGMRTMLLADLDQSGTLDILHGNAVNLASSTKGRLTTRFGTAGFAFSSPVHVATAAGGPPFAFVFLHADGDALDDLAAIQLDPPTFGNATRLTIFRGVGAGAFTYASSVPIGPHTTAYHSLATARLDGDSIDDLVYGSVAALEVRALQGTGAGGFVESGRYGVAAGPRDLIAADLDQDGRDDLIGSAPFTLVRDSHAGPCAGSAIEYGSGCHGTTAFTPHLTVNGCVAPGGTIKITLTGAEPPTGGVALCFLGAGPANAPVGNGCSLLVFPIVGDPLQLPLWSYAGYPGAGSSSVMGIIPLATPIGSSAFLQAFVPVPGPSFKASNGVQITF